MLTRFAPTPADPDAPGPIGLDVSEAGVRMIQLVAADGAPAVHALAAWNRETADGALPLSGDRGNLLDRGRLRDRVQRMLESAPFSGRRVVAAVPRELLHVRTVRVPAADEDPGAGAGPAGSVATAARAEAAALFPFDLRGAVVQFLPAGLVRQGEDVCREVIVLAAPRRDLDPFVAGLHSAGLLVESLDAEPCALYRSIVHSRSAISDEAPEAAYVLIDVGRLQTQVVVGRGPDVTFIKPIPVGAQHLDKAVVRKLGVTPAEARLVRRRVSASAAPAGGEAGAVPFSGAGHDAVRQALSDATRPAVEQLARTLASYLRYHAVTFRGPGPRQVEILGAESDNELLRASLAALLGLPVVAPDAPAGLGAREGESASAIPAAAGAWAAAVGLALKKLSRVRPDAPGLSTRHRQSSTFAEPALA